MILNSHIKSELPTDFQLDKKKRDELFDKFITKEADHFANKLHTNFMSDLDDKVPKKTALFQSGTISDYDRLNSFIFKDKFPIRGTNSNLFLDDRGIDKDKFKRAKGFKLYSFFDDMHPEVDYRHTNDLYYGLKLEGKTPQDFVLNNASLKNGQDIRNLDPTTRGILQLRDQQDPTYIANNFTDSFIQNNLGSTTNSVTSSVHSSVHSSKNNSKVPSPVNSARKENTALIDALKFQDDNSDASPNKSSKPPSRRNSDVEDVLNGAAKQLEHRQKQDETGKGLIKIGQAAKSHPYSKLYNAERIGYNALSKFQLKKGFQHWSEQIREGKKQEENERKEQNQKTLNEGIEKERERRRKAESANPDGNKEKSAPKTPKSSKEAKEEKEEKKPEKPTKQNSQTEYTPDQQLEVIKTIYDLYGEKFYTDNQIGDEAAKMIRDYTTINARKDSKWNNIRIILEGQQNALEKLTKTRIGRPKKEEKKSLADVKELFNGGARASKAAAGGGKVNFKDQSGLGFEQLTPANSKPADAVKSSSTIQRSAKNLFGNN